MNANPDKSLNIILGIALSALLFVCCIIFSIGIVISKFVSKIWFAISGRCPEHVTPIGAFIFFVAIVIAVKIYDRKVAQDN